MAVVDTNALISVQDASEMGISKLLALAEQGQVKIVLRHNRPVAAVISISQLEDVQAAMEDLADAAAAEARVALSGGKRTSLDDVLNHFGYSRDELRQDPAY
jgi:antitoxin (DNA-binding transcriptional repressor) of toxin-antitoxin stability system